MSTGFLGTIRQNFTLDDGSPLTGSRIEVGGSSSGINASFPGGSTNEPLAMTLTVANIQAIFLVSNVDLTLETNSGTSPANTINLKAGSPLVWSKSDAYFANPFTTNVTGFFITCAAAARLRGYILTS